MKFGKVMSELLKKIAEGEGVSLDFKFRVDDQKKIARTLAAYANTEGGSLLIGVKDNGKVAGADPEEEYYMVEGAASMYCRPAVPIESKVWKEGHHLVLEIIVCKSDLRHKAVTEEGNWKTYYRIDDNTAKGNKILDKVWFYQREGVKRSRSFSEDEMDLLAFIRTNELVSISKIYKASKMKMNQTDNFIAALLHWEVLSMVFSDDGIRYGLSE